MTKQSSKRNCCIEAYSKGGGKTRLSLNNIEAYEYVKHCFVDEKEELEYSELLDQEELKKIS